MVMTMTSSMIFTKLTTTKTISMTYTVRLYIYYKIIRKVQ